MAHDHCHCRDYTRSQMLSAAAAKAGEGLPSIEMGMPDPAGTGLTRRTFVFRAAGMALAVYGASKLPFQALEEGIAHAATPNDNVLVSIFFDGGIDSLNVLAPLDYGLYNDLRPNLRLRAADYPSGTNLNEWVQSGSTAGDRLYWHPSAAKLRQLDIENKVTVFPAIGYDGPDQSHFTSRHYYEVGQTEVNVNTGWLGRYLDAYGAADNPLQGLSLAYELSPMLATATNPVAAVADVTNYDLPNHTWGGDIEANLYQSFKNLGNKTGDGSEAMRQTLRTIQQTSQVREELSTFGSNLGTPAAVAPLYPANNELSRQLRSLAAIIASPNLHVSAVTLSATGGYDTHSNQITDLRDNLKATSDAVYAFQKDLEARDLDDRVLMNMWSEFGRRPEENGSGTDHGAAGLGFVIGTNASGNTIGNFPGLVPNVGLDQYGNLRKTSDFRSLYMTLMEDWMGVPDPSLIVPGGFAKQAGVLL